MTDIDIERAHEIEAEIRHDVMAEVRTYAEQCSLGGGIIHLGATSMDVVDNADAMRQYAALDLLLARLADLLLAFAEQIERWASHTCIGWTHLQPAEPTTIGYRLANYAQDLLNDYADLLRIRGNLRGKGFKGAVGTGASYAALLDGTGMALDEFEGRVMDALGIRAFDIAHQTYPRRQDRVLIESLAGLAGTLYRFAFDLRLLQSPPIGEWAEPFGKKQVGSSAMPFKRNPINAENLDSLGRYVASLPRVMWDNAAHALLERTLDDSANRRSVIPEAFLAVDEMLIRATYLVRGLVIKEETVARNMARYGTFAATERVLMALGRAGADRQQMHERIREHSMVAWEAIHRDRPNPLNDLLADDEAIVAYVPAEQVRALMDASGYVGDAPQRARRLAQTIHERIAVRTEEG
jgi:adenylosuccinate lyase